MKLINKMLVVLIATLLVTAPAAGVYAQTQDSSSAKTRQRFATKNPEAERTASVDNGLKVTSDANASKQTAEQARTAKKGNTGSGEESVEPGVDGDQTDNSLATSKTPVDVPEETRANRHEQPSEEADIVPYYNNFFNTYRLGPEDIISVSVFGQDRYSRSGITIPPSGRISLTLIPGGIFVNGKTVDEVAELIKKRYDEYIIDPQVDVSLDKASSYRYSVIGDVAQPGIRLMSRRLTVTEALGEAGGVLQTGDRSRVVVLRRQADGNLKPIPVNVSAIYKGRVPDMTYLVPGDQVIVPGNKMKSLQKIMSFFPILSFARIFTGGLLP
jgi:polysaccharide export outer membrane protein